MRRISFPAFGRKKLGYNNCRSVTEALHDRRHRARATGMTIQTSPGAGAESPLASADVANLLGNFNGRAFAE
ncbi:MAG TPA: hypothetical protein VF123_09460 [Candidatus Sulfotelmatobacter sp.]